MFMRRAFDRFFLFHQKRLYHYALVAVICLTLLSRLSGLSKGLWNDEFRSVSLITSEEFWTELRQDNHPPLYLVLLRIWGQVSVCEPYLRLLSVVFGFGTVLIMMRWISRYSQLAGVLAGLLCASSPLLLRYSQELRGYPLLFFAAAAAMFFAARLTSEPGNFADLLGLSGSLAAAVSTHMLGIMLLPPVLLYIALSVEPHAYRKIHPGMTLAAFSIPILFSVFFYAFFLHMPEKGNWWMPVMSVRLMSSTLANITGISALFSVGDTLQSAFPFLASFYYFGVLVSLSAIGIILAVFGDWRRSGPLFAAAILYWLQLIVYSLLFQPIFWYRTVLPGVLPFFGFISVQLATVRLKRIRTASIAGIVGLALILLTGWMGYKAWIPYEHWKQVCEVVAKRWKTGDHVACYPRYIEGALRYYVPQIPLDAKILIPAGVDYEEEDIEAFFAGVNSNLSQEPAPQLFFLVRHDYNLNQTPDVYHNILAHLSSTYGPPILAEKFGTISLWQFR